MNKSGILFISFLTISYLSNAQILFRQKNITVFDSIYAPGILKQCGSRVFPEEINGYWNITPVETSILSRKFKKIKFLTSDICCNPGYKVGSLKKYLFQVTGLLIKGEKYIYINAFPKEFANSSDSERVFFVCDGGTSYWGCLFSIKDYRFSQLAFNGPPHPKD